MARLMASLAPLAERFAGGSGTSGLADLGAALQLARQGFGTADEAATGLESLMGAIVAHADKLEAVGIKVFTKDAKTGKKELRGFQEIVEAIGNSKLGKDPTLLIKALGRKEALAAFLQLTKVQGAWDGLAQSTMNANDVAQDYAAFTESTAGRLQASWNELTNAVAEVFTPERIRAFIEGFKELLAIAGAARDMVLDIGRTMGYLAPSDEQRKAGRDKLLDKYKDVTDDELQEIHARGDGSSEAAREAYEVFKLRRSEREREARERARFDRESEAFGGAPAVGLAQPSYDMQAESDQYDAAAGQGRLRTGPREVKYGRSRVDVNVKVQAGPGLRAEVDNDPRQRVSP
jgi:hypothetical protein